MVFTQLCGSNSPRRLLDQVGSFVNTSLRYAQGSAPQSLANSISVISTAALLPAWAMRTGVLAADMAMHEEACRLAIELLADFFADTRQGMAGSIQPRVDS